MNNISNHARLKIKRANSHIDTLIQQSAPLSRDLYEIRIETARSVVLLVEPDLYKLAYRPKEPISQHFGSIIGDVFNNLRESLDYWITAAISLFDKSRRMPNFPFEADEGKDFETNSQYVAIKKAFPDLAAFILTDIQPRKSTNFDLWAISNLCNGNKHNDFLPVVSVTSVDNINARSGTNSIKKCACRGDADHPIFFICSNEPITMENGFNTSVEMMFPHGALFENKPVIPTLLHLSQITTQTIDALDNFIDPYVR